MDGSSIAAFSLVAALLVMSPGPNGFLVARTVPTSGRSAGFANVSGFAVAFFLHGSLSILGLSIILMQSSLAFAVVKYLGAAYLVWIGVKSLLAAWRGSNRPASAPAPAKRRRTLLRAFGEGFLTNALNPKVSMFYLAAFPQFLGAGETSATAAYMLVALHSSIAVIWFSAMVLLMSRLTAAASSARFQRWLQGVTGLVFIGFGLKLASYRPSV